MFLLSQANRRSGSLGLEKVNLFGGLVYVVTYLYVLCAKSMSISIEQRKIVRSRWFDKCSSVENFDFHDVYSYILTSSGVSFYPRLINFCANFPHNTFLHQPNHMKIVSLNIFGLYMPTWIHANTPP